MSRETVARRLASFVTGLRPGDIPGQVAEKARVITLHNLGVALAGYPGVQNIFTLSRQKALANGGGARLLIDGTRLQPADAAFANGALIHSRAQDDVHLGAYTHVGCTVLPAALATAEALGKSGADYLTAMIAGYEVAAALGKVGGRTTTPRGFRATGIYGPIGAAAAAAKLMDLTEEQTAHAIAIATSLSAGLNQTWVDGSHEWRFQVGQAARNGILAAELASVGGVGATQSFEGAMGFFAAFAGDRSLAGAVGKSLGERWESLAVTFKPHPVCAIMQTPVETVLRMMKANGISADRVSRVKILLNPGEAAYPGTDGPGPFSDVGATLMSAQFCLSVAINRGEVRLKHLYEFDTPEYKRLWPNIQVVPDDSLPSGSCRLEMVTTDGRTVRDEYLATGSTFNYTAEEEAALVRGLLSETDLTPARLEELIQGCLSVDRLPNVAALVDLACTVPA